MVVASIALSCVCHVLSFVVMRRRDRSSAIVSLCGHVLFIGDVVCFCVAQSPWFVNVSRSACVLLLL